MSTAKIEKLKEMLDRNPQDPFLWFAIAREYENHGYDEEAYRYYNELQNREPDYVGTYYHLGIWHQKQGNQERASEVFKKGIVVAKKQRDHHALAELKMALEMQEEE